MHSSENAASTGVQQQTSPRATRISFPPTQRFSLPGSTAVDSARVRKQRLHLMHSWDVARDALAVDPIDFIALQ